jgi:hypothetical protein
MKIYLVEVLTKSQPDTWSPNTVVIGLKLQDLLGHVSRAIANLESVTDFRVRAISIEDFKQLPKNVTVLVRQGSL